jgi:hypothetical protein
MPYSHQHLCAMCLRNMETSAHTEHNHASATEALSAADSVVLWIRSGGKRTLAMSRISTSV